MIKKHSHQFTLRLMCRLLSVSVSGYYDWRDRKPSCREEANRQLTDKIKTIFDDEKSRAGSIRITKRLNNEGESVGKHRVAKIMRSNGSATSPIFGPRKDGSTLLLLWIYILARSSDGLCLNE